MADMLYFCRVVTAILLNFFLPKSEEGHRRGQKNRYFFSFYPQTFDHQLSEIRYRDMVGPSDAYLVTIIADGMHQQVAMKHYPRFVRSISNPKFVLIDRQLDIQDLPEALWTYWSFHQYRYWTQGSEYVFQGINISRYIRQELLWSASRVARLTVVEKALDRTLAGLAISELVYPNFEYAFGRMISALIGNKYKGVVRTGFNHGDYSWRFINYFMAQEEASVSPPYLSQCPIPDRVLAEDRLCAEIYRYNGYHNVDLMDKVTRLDYLQYIKPKKLEKYALIAAGLHDGEALMASMGDFIDENSQVSFLLKPHPRAKSLYLKTLPHFSNLQVVDDPIQELLEYVGRVYVTYSGVGVEAARLGIPTTLVHIPGRISWSKLLDYQGNELNQTNVVLGSEGGQR
jgi:hypothetical protein